MRRKNLDSKEDLTNLFIIYNNSFSSLTYLFSIPPLAILNYQLAIINYQLPITN
ncbi:hypothetical protein [Mastigocoleus testarum]|nr:hypothetical protein [Mastigocoleus testarum]